MSMPLLQTKLYAPPSRSHLVQRNHLLDQLWAHGLCPLTLVSAPAGFGKTTLVSAWVAERQKVKRKTMSTIRFSLLPSEVAWVSLDDDDNDPTRFLTYVLAALQTCHPDLGGTALTLMAAPQAPPPKAILTSLLNDLGTIATPLLLVLDDYHLIEAQSIHDTLTFLIDHLPPTLHLVITSRIDPPLPLARWRVRNQLVELRADDLRFTPAEATTFLMDVMGLTLSATEITALELRTEGWIAGLQLAALSMQGRNDVAGFIQAFSGSHHHVWRRRMIGWARSRCYWKRSPSARPAAICTMP
jgi:LuxR family transcriptional regulator, maltose regulon positive regulatory protein